MTMIVSVHASALILDRSGVASSDAVTQVITTTVRMYLMLRALL